MVGCAILSDNTFFASQLQAGVSLKNTVPGPKLILTSGGATWVINPAGFPLHFRCFWLT